MLMPQVLVTDDARTDHDDLCFDIYNLLCLVCSLQLSGLGEEDLCMIGQCPKFGWNEVFRGSGERGRRLILRE